MVSIVIYLAIAIQVMTAIAIFTEYKAESKKREEYYDKAFAAYQREYLCKNEKDIKRELKRFSDCKYLVYNELKKK